MKSILLFCLALFVFSACTNESNNEKSVELIAYDSPIRYQFKKLDDPEAAAMVEETPVSWSQLLSNDVALQELQNQLNHKAMAFAYSWAKNMGSQNDSELTVYIAKPEAETKDILQQQRVELSDSLSVKFEPEKTSSTVLASFGDKQLSWADFLNANIQHSKLYERVFAQRMQRLNGIVIRRYLLQASKDANLGMEEFVRTKILPTPMEPTEQDVRDFANNKGIAESDLDEKMMERLKEIVRQNHRDDKIADYVAKKLIKKPIPVAFNRPSIKVETPEISEDIPHWGKEEAPALVFVGHWSCEDCGGSLKSFLKTREKFGNDLKGAFIYSFPERDREARMGAEAALCVKEQSDESFWTFLNKIMDLKGESVEDTINLAAQGSGVDYDKFRDCFLKRQFQKDVESHLTYAKSLGLTQAPLMILQGQVLELPVDTKMISQKLKDLGVHSHKKGLWARIKSFFGLGA